MSYKKLTELFTRYILIAALGLSNLFLIYKVLTPLTIHSVNTIINILTPTLLQGNIIHFSQTTIQIVPACVAGSAFYLLLALILSTANIPTKTRLKALGASLLTLFLINIIRILFLASITNSPSFETIHWIFWHLASTIFVVAIYIATIKFYKIKSIPIISDIKYIKSLTKS